MATARASHPLISLYRKTDAAPGRLLPGPLRIVVAIAASDTGRRDLSLAHARIPVTALTTVTPCPLWLSRVANSARRWNAAARCGTSPTTTAPGTGTAGRC